VEATGARSVEILAGTSLHDHHVDTSQREFGRQHQACRAAACDHHVVIRHRVIVSTICSFAASPLSRAMLLVAGDVASLRRE